MAKHYVTSETALTEAMQTRWYKASQKQAMDACVKVIEGLGVEPLVVDNEYGEIYFEAKDFDMTITVFEISTLETSVDIDITGKKVFDFGATKKNMIAFYASLGKLISFKGLALHK